MENELNHSEEHLGQEATGTRFTQFMAYLFVIMVMVFLFVKIVFL